MTDADKLVEDCARMLQDTHGPMHEDFARAVSRAALTLAVERCAQVAGAEFGYVPPAKIAARIRSLSPNAKGETHE